MEKAGLVPHFDEWIGRRHDQVDVLEPARTNALQAALGKHGEFSTGEPLPLLHHWLYFWNVEPPAKLGQDGHPATGGLLPPIDLPRRMWAGGRVRFLAPLLVGSTVRKTTTIRSVVEKSGRSGRLIFVTLCHELVAEGRCALIEEQDLVYREEAQESAPLPQPAPIAEYSWEKRVEPDPVLLFRYSALTMNGHRIHYDWDFSTGVERYPGLVVHGPLQATLMIDLAVSRLSGKISQFEYRGLRPAFAGHSLNILGSPTASGADLWVQQGSSNTMSGSVTID